MSQLNILDLNEDAFQAIFSRLSFDDIAKVRLVCTRFDKTCQTLLNKGFAAVKLYNKKCQKEITSLLPRRDSQREVHPLAQHLAALTSMETSFYLLGHESESIRFGVTISFIPGKILDESYRVLREVMAKKQTQIPLDFHELLDELDDLTYTATNHFNEHIRPSIKRKKKLATRKFISSHRPPSKLTKKDLLLINSQRKKISELESKVSEQEKELNDHKQKFIQLEKHLGFSLSPKSTCSAAPSNPPVASTSTDNQRQQMGKRSVQADEEEQGSSKRLQPNQKD